MTQLARRFRLRAVAAGPATQLICYHAGCLPISGDCPCQRPCHDPAQVADGSSSDTWLHDGSWSCISRMQRSSCSSRVTSVDMAPAVSIAAAIASPTFVPAQPFRLEPHPACGKRPCSSRLPKGKPHRNLHAWLFSGLDPGNNPTRSSRVSRVAHGTACHGFTARDGRRGAGCAQDV